MSLDCFKSAVAQHKKLPQPADPTQPAARPQDAAAEQQGAAQGAHRLTRHPNAAAGAALTRPRRRPATRSQLQRHRLYCSLAAACQARGSSGLTGSAPDLVRQLQAVLEAESCMSCCEEEQLQQTLQQQQQQPGAPATAVAQQQQQQQRAAAAAADALQALRDELAAKVHASMSSAKATRAAAAAAAAKVRCSNGAKACCSVHAHVPHHQHVPALRMQAAPTGGGRAAVLAELAAAQKQLLAAREALKQQKQEQEADVSVRGVWVACRACVVVHSSACEYAS